LDEINEKYNGAEIEKNEFYCPDPTGMRTGQGVGPQLSATIDRVIQDTLEVLHTNCVQRKIPISLPLLQEKMDNIRGVVIMGKFFSPPPLKYNE